jgi:hypothetical protein
MSTTTTERRPPALVESFEYGASRPIARHLNIAVSVHRLSDDDARALVELVAKATPEARAFNLNELRRRDRAKFERLTARAAGLPDDHFDRSRRDEAAAVKMRELALRVVRPRKPTQRQERTLMLELCSHVQKRLMTAPTLAVVVLAVGSIFDGSTSAPGGETVGSGAELRLVLDARFGFGEVDLPRWKQSLDYAARAQWLVVERQSQRVEIGLGPRVLRLMELSA